MKKMLDHETLIISRPEKHYQQGFTQFDLYTKEETFTGFIDLNYIYII